jgi:hypothetical protein
MNTRHYCFSLIHCKFNLLLGKTPNVSMDNCFSRNNIVFTDCISYRLHFIKIYFDWALFTGIICCDQELIPFLRWQRYKGNYSKPLFHFLQRLPNALLYLLIFFSNSILKSNSNFRLPHFLFLRL